MKNIPLYLKIKKNLFVILLFILGLEGMFLLSGYKKTLDVNCQSYLTYISSEHEFTIQTTMQIVLEHEGQGHIGLDGIMSSGELSWRVNRDISFDYTKRNNTSIKMDNFHIAKSRRDNAPDEILSRYFFSLSKDSNRILTVHKVKNGFLIGTMRSPASLCLP